MGNTRFSTEIIHSVRWGEMDALNHVNNAQYFSYFEDARIAYLANIGYGNVSIDEGTGPILANISCDFIKPITFPDTITIGVGTTRIGSSSMTVEYEVYSENMREIVAKGSSVIVMVDYTSGKSSKIPDWMRDKMKEVDSSLLS